MLGKCLMCTLNKRFERKPKCENCGETGHLAAGKALPVIKKTPSTRQPGKRYAQAAADKTKNEEQTGEKETEAKTDEDTVLTNLKDSLQALKEVKMLLQEFPTLLEASRLCIQAKTKQEKALLVLSALMGD
ncbi:hypothetical protein AVEN_177635-1 [Araneus ventricosus]|uniref:CCHC-type domain-containing protein n=1 Tax=Araneus ventricosus TaxID=182803 RepID=A0A4Y2KLJ6_ARAVE|nr:hypothetical protein AVEN_177635-1 [Araneus ventricosus]